jgi:hypothetical protein
VRAALLAVMLVTGCTSVPPRPPAPPVPTELRDCSGGVALPAPLARVRTVEMLAAYAVRLELARHAEADARRDCSGRLRLLNEWIDRKSP